MKSTTSALVTLAAAMMNSALDRQKSLASTWHAELFEIGGVLLARARESGMVAAGNGVGLSGEHGRLYHTQLGVAFVPIHDAPPLDWALAWRATAENPLIRAFAQAADEVGSSSLDDVNADWCSSENSGDSAPRPLSGHSGRANCTIV